MDFAISPLPNIVGGEEVLYFIIIWRGGENTLQKGLLHRCFTSGSEVGLLQQVGLLKELYNYRRM